MEEIIEDIIPDPVPGTEKTPKETVVPESTEPEKAEISKELQSALAQKEHWRKKAEQLAKVAPKSQPATEDDWKNKVDFLLTNKDFNEQEFNHIQVVAKERGVSYQEAAKMESDYIAFQREKIKKENKTPSPSSATSILSEKQIRPDTPKEEIEKILKERFERLQGGRDTGY